MDLGLQPQGVTRPGSTPVPHRGQVFLDPSPQSSQKLMDMCTGTTSAGTLEELEAFYYQIASKWLISIN
jgi:hypothetical protein